RHTGLVSDWSSDVCSSDLLVSPALAHTGVEDTNSFASGIAHPLHGADHILAMVAVGLWAALPGGRAIWAWPTAFIAMMLTGFAEIGRASCRGRGRSEGAVG